jgi:predicted chitinase
MPDTVDSGSVLVTLLLCGLMGMLGQGIRAAVGLKNATRLNATPLAASGATQQASFNAAYFFLSMMIGFIAGVLAGLTIGLTNILKVNVGDMKVLLGIAAAGYAGTDFIENSFSIVIPGTTAPPPPQPAPAPPQISRGIDNPSLATLIEHTDALKTSILSLRDHTAALTASTPALPPFGTALHIVAPRVDIQTWTQPLATGFTQFGLTTDKRIAAAIGQFLVEAGDEFQELVEDLRYTTASRLCQIFPREFPTEADAEPFLDNPEALGNRVYANKLGNGNEASGDGFRFRGRGLIQLTGRNEYAEFGASIGMTAEQAADYCQSPMGAAVSGCWYLSSRGCLPFADSWNLDEITRRVNGRAMVDHAKRVAFSNAMLRALGGETQPGT